MVIGKGQVEGFAFGFVFGAGVLHLISPLIVFIVGIGLLIASHYMDFDYLSFIERCRYVERVE